MCTVGAGCVFIVAIVQIKGDGAATPLNIARCWTKEKRESP